MENVFDVFSQWWNLLLIPVTSVITWFVSRSKRKAEDVNYLNDAINKLQETCSRLVEENAELINKVTRLNIELAESKKEITILQSKIEIMIRNGGAIQCVD